MSRTDKDKSLKWLTEEDWAKRPSRRKRAGKGNLVKGYEDGPGGKSCSCCGVEMEYKHRSRAQGKADALAGYVEWLEQVS
jgi:hypothetical protein